MTVYIIYTHHNNMQIICRLSDKGPTHPTPTIKSLIYRPYISDICCAKSRVSRHFQSLACCSTVHPCSVAFPIYAHYEDI